MAYSTLIGDITTNIKTNGNNEITGAVLQTQLLNIIANLGAGATFMGEGTPSTDTSTIGDKQVVYIANTQGTYTNMGGYTLSSGFAFFVYNGASWTFLPIPQTPAAGSVTTAILADGAVTTPKLADAAVTTAKVNNGAITSAKIENGAVGENQLAQECVDTINLKQDAVMEENIFDGSVTTPKIANGAITAAKISPDVPLGSKMAIVTLPDTTTSIVAQTDKYYSIIGTLNTLTITLPSMVGVDEVKGCVVYLKTGTLAEGSGITITTANPNESVVYYDGFEWADNTKYELNCVWNGVAWVIAYGIVVA